MKTKKAQGLPLNVIIIAVIVLVVLVVLWVIFTGRAEQFSTAVAKTDGKLKTGTGGVDVDEKSGKLTGLDNILNAFIPFLPLWQRKRRFIGFGS